MRARIILIFFAIAAFARLAAGDPVHVQTEEPRLLCKPPAPSVLCRDVPPGRFLDELTYQALDAEMRRLQEAEVRLGAENASLRESASSGPSWRLVGAALAAGLAVGAGAAWLR